MPVPRLFHALPCYALVVSLSLLHASPVQALVFTIDTTSDANLSDCTAAAADCSLRGAITKANLTVARDQLNFDIPETDPGFQTASGHWRILVGATTLPFLSEAMDVDGYSQPGASPATQSPDQGGINAVIKIELMPAQIAGNQQVGLDIGLANFNMPASTIRGLAISGFSSQIQLAGGFGHAIEGCFLGTDPTGTTATISNPTVQTTAIRIQGPGPYRIGGLQPAQRNLISGVRNGINWFVASSGMVIQGNQFGTNAAGTAAIPIHGDGFGIVGSWTNTLVGDDTTAGRNIFAAISFSAIRIFGQSINDFTGTRIVGNWFGTDITGTKALGNGRNPQSPTQKQATIHVSGSNCRLNIGGLNPGEPNRIAFGGAAGLLVDQCNGLSAIANEFIGNQLIPIDNAFGGGAVGATPNDVDDADSTGGNRLQNYPELTLPPDFAPTGSDQVALQYRVDTATTNAVYPLTVYFFRGACGGGSASLLASDTYVSADAEQLRSFNLQSGDVGNVLPLVVLAVDAQGNSSEFAPMIGERIFGDGLEDTPAADPGGSCPGA
ncbi:hypothetical protein [Ahniella affigens]|nr:hypothetical protein [Ahniella affigens]